MKDLPKGSFCSHYMVDYHLAHEHTEQNAEHTKPESLILLAFVQKVFKAKAEKIDLACFSETEIKKKCLCVNTLKLKSFPGIVSLSCHGGV